MHVCDSVSQQALTDTAVSYQIAIGHSDKCFSRQYGKYPPEHRNYDKGNIKLASCIVLEDKDNKVFLTLRNKKMRVFPNSWVLPGGHIDPGESLEQGAIRELSEETGIHIEKNNDQLTYQGRSVELLPYYAYESSIPTKWFQDTATYDKVSCPLGHLIIYFYIKLDVSSTEIKVKLEPKEVAACAWLDRNQLQKILNRSHKHSEEII